MAQHTKCIIEHIFHIGLLVVVVHHFVIPPGLTACVCSVCLEFRYSSPIEENALVLTKLRDMQIGPG